MHALRSRIVHARGTGGLSEAAGTVRGMALTLGMVSVDTLDARELAQWWADQTGGELDDPYDGWFVTLKGGGLPVMLAFQKVDDPTPGTNKVHLDLTSADVDAEVGRLVAAGATLVERRGDEGFRWATR